MDIDAKFDTFLPVVQLYKVPANLDIISASQSEDDLYFKDTEPLDAFMRIKNSDGRVVTTLFTFEGVFASCDRVKLMPKNAMSFVINTEKGVFWLRFIDKMHVIGFLKTILNAKRTEVTETREEVATPELKTPKETHKLVNDDELMHSAGFLNPKRTEATETPKEVTPPELKTPEVMPKLVNDDELLHSAGFSNAKRTEVTVTPKQVAPPKLIKTHGEMHKILNEDELKKKKLEERERRFGKVPTTGFSKTISNTQRTEATETPKEVAAPVLKAPELPPKPVKEDELKKRKLDESERPKTTVNDVRDVNDSDDEIMVLDEIKGDANKPSGNLSKRAKSEKFSDSFELCTNPVFQDYTLPIAVEARIDLKRLIVSRLKKSVRNIDLDKLFPGAVDIQIEKESKKYNMAFIRFRNAEDAKRSLDRMNHKEVFGRAITITYANKIFSL